MIGLLRLGKRNFLQISVTFMLLNNDFHHKVWNPKQTKIIDTETMDIEMKVKKAIDIRCQCLTKYWPGSYDLLVIFNHFLSRD